MRLLKPLRLNDGDTIDVVAPSFPARPTRDKIDQDLAQLRETGLFDKLKGMLIGNIRGENPARSGEVKDMTHKVRKIILEITAESIFPSYQTWISVTIHPICRSL